MSVATGSLCDPVRCISLRLWVADSCTRRTGAFILVTYLSRVVRVVALDRVGLFITLQTSEKGFL